MKKGLFTFVVVTAFIFSFTSLAPKIFAATGGGTATIARDGGAQGAGVSVEQNTSHTFTAVLTINVSGMTLGAASPTFTIPVGFTAPNASPVATAGAVNADGKWSVVAGTGSCVVDSAPGSLLTTATGQVITVDITADCADGDTITLTYKGTSAVTMGATALTVSTANAGDPGPVTPITAGSPTITVTDTIAPTVTIDSDKTTLKKGETAAITFTLSESSINFIAGDVSVAGGILSAFAGSGTSYTATFTPTDESTTLATINVATPTFTDTAGNANVVATQKSMTVDTAAPTVVVTMSDSALTVGETALVTFTFSEAPTGFTTDDVTVANGSIGAIDASNSLIQTATYTPTSGIEDSTNVITVGTVWTDTALNTGVGGNSPNYTINTVAAASSPSGSRTGNITVVKIVINDSGGTKTIADFPLFVNSTSVTSGVAKDFPAPSLAYTITETSNAGYTQSFSGACDPITGHLTLSPGDNKICIITNNDIGPPVAVVPPLIDVIKTASPLSLPAGPGPVTYTYTLRNIGTVPVTDVTMVGDTCSPIVRVSGDTNADNKLDVSETWVHTCSTNLSATHTNTVVATGWANGISATDIASATVVVGAPVVPPLIHVTKIPSPLTLSSRGGLVAYTYTLANPGLVAIDNVRVTDDKCSPVDYMSGDTNNDSKLDISETWTYLCKKNLVKTTTNTVTATGNANGLTATDIAIVTVLVPYPGLPKTGLPPPLTNTPWSIAMLTFIVLYGFYRNSIASKR